MGTIAYKNQFYGNIADSSFISNVLGNFANIETSPATSAHNIGDFVVYGDKLYKVTAAINVGDSLVVGTNISVTDVGTEVSQINSNFDNLQIRKIKGYKKADSQGTISVAIPGYTASFVSATIQFNDINGEIICYNAMAMLTDNNTKVQYKSIYYVNGQSRWLETTALTYIIVFYT